MTRVVLVPHGFQQHYAIGFANAVAQEGFPVDFVTIDRWNPGFLDSRIDWKNLGQTKGPDRPLWERLTRLLLYHVRLCLYLLARGRSVIHVIGVLPTTFVSGILEGLWIRAIGRKYILTVHNLLPHDRHTASNKVLYWLIYRIPHVLVVHTEQMQRELIDSFHVPHRKILIMQHGVNDVVPDHGKERVECRQILGVPEERCMLLFFGRLAPYKGLETLLTAVEGLDERFVLVIAGRGITNAYQRQIEDLVAVHLHRDRIVCRTGFVANEDIATYFRAADVLVLPYRHIDQSGVVFLALRFGLPILAFDVGAFDEFVKGDAGIVLSGDGASDLAAGIRLFERKRDSFRRESIREYARRHQWSRVLTPILPIYRS